MSGEKIAAMNIAENHTKQGSATRSQPGPGSRASRATGRHCTVVRASWRGNQVRAVRSCSTQSPYATGSRAPNA